MPSKNEYKSIVISPFPIGYLELKYRECEEFVRKEILKQLGIPPHLLGNTNDNYSSMLVHYYAKQNKT